MEETVKIKILILGERRVGKSTLALMYSYGKLEDPLAHSTFHIDFVGSM